MRFYTRRSGPDSGRGEVGNICRRLTQTCYDLVRKGRQSRAPVDKLRANKGRFIQSTYDNPRGKEMIKQAVAVFREFIVRLEEIYNVRPFNQQSVGSLLEMFLVTLTVEPKTIVEIGTGTRSSTLALALAAARLRNPCKIYGIDIAPVDFIHLTNRFFKEFKFNQVTDIKMNLADFDIPADWERPMLMLYDAHDNDIPGVVISEHAITHWFPKLAGQVIMVHDCSVFAADLQLNLDGDHVSALHFSDRKVVGFREVKTIVKWMNDSMVDFYRPNDELRDLGFEGLDSSLIYFIAPMKTASWPSAQAASA